MAFDPAETIAQLNNELGFQQVAIMQKLYEVTTLPSSTAGEGQCVLYKNTTDQNFSIQKLISSVWNRITLKLSYTDTSKAIIDEDIEVWCCGTFKGINDRAELHLSSFNTSSGQGNIVEISKSNSATETLNETVDGTRVIRANFNGVDSDDAVQAMARIDVDQDGSAGSGYVPGKMVFYTSSTALTEHFTIAKDGKTYYKATKQYKPCDTGNDVSIGASTTQAVAFNWTFDSAPTVTVSPGTGSTGNQTNSTPPGVINRTTTGFTFDNTGSSTAKTFSWAAHGY